jgi:hypothetical protein
MAAEQQNKLAHTARIRVVIFIRGWDLVDSGRAEAFDQPDDAGGEKQELLIPSKAREKGIQKQGDGSLKATKQ